jgi:hypothetical protein
MHLKKPQQLLNFHFIQKKYPTTIITRTPISDKHLIENVDVDFNINPDIFQLNNSTNFLSSLTTI